jgi:hypothetical protein
MTLALTFAHSGACCCRQRKTSAFQLKDKLGLPEEVNPRGCGLSSPRVHQSSAVTFKTPEMGSSGWTWIPVTPSGGSPGMRDV